MTAAHTPGPWAVDPQDDALIVTGPYRQHIARVATRGMGHAVSPNARLVAASPRLLAALRAMLAKHDDRDGMSDMWPREAAMAREAIAAAIEGE
jgi:hypothetical protein